MATKLEVRAPDWADVSAEIAAAIADKAGQHDSEETFVDEGFALLKRAGLFKALVPEEFGGHGATHEEICRVVRRLGASCGSTALAFSMHCHMVSVAAWRWRHQGAPTEGLLKRVAGEELVLVSSGGSDWLQSAGTAVRTEGGFLITAKKAFASASPVGDLLVTSAVYDDPEAGLTVLHFAVPLKGPGVTLRNNWQVLGMRGTGSQEVVLENVFVPDAAISGKRPQGKWHPLFHAISMIAFSLIYSAYAGVADGARAKAVAMARGRSPDEGLTQLVGEMENAWMGMDLALEDMILLAETGTPGPEATARAMAGRTLVAQGAIGTVERALEVAGGAAFYRRAGLERAFRDVQGARFHPLQEKAQLRYSGRLALGLDIDG
jgi:acyl-CoA dehydrogenase